MTSPSISLPPTERTLILLHSQTVFIPRCYASSTRSSAPRMPSVAGWASAVRWRATCGRCRSWLGSASTSSACIHRSWLASKRPCAGSRRQPALGLQRLRSSSTAPRLCASCCNARAFMDEARDGLPGFNRQEMLADVREAFVQLEAAVSTARPSGCRPFVGAALYEQVEGLVDELAAHGLGRVDGSFESQ